MNKEKRIIDIKSVQDFYKALRDEVAKLFNDYERYGIFDGWTEKQKKECFGFGTHILSIVYNPIQKRYTKQERKKYDKIIDDYEEICKRKNRQIKNLQSQLAEKEKEIDKLTAKLEQANEIINNPDTLIFQQQELIDNLQSQLAEKEKTLKYKTAECEKWKRIK